MLGLRPGTVRVCWPVGVDTNPVVLTTLAPSNIVNVEKKPRPLNSKLVAPVLVLTVAESRADANNEFAAATETGINTRLKHNNNVSITFDLFFFKFMPLS